MPPNTAYLIIHASVVLQIMILEADLLMQMSQVTIMLDRMTTVCWQEYLEELKQRDGYA